MTHPYIGSSSAPGLLPFFLTPVPCCCTACLNGGHKPWLWTLLSGEARQIQPVSEKLLHGGWGEHKVEKEVWFFSNLLSLWKCM